MTGELCSQPPLGVAEIRFPKRSAMSRWTVPRPGSPEPTVAATSWSDGRRPSPGPVLGGGVLADERAPLVVVRLREQPLERHLLGVAVERVAVGERELPALDDDVDELGGRELARGRSPASSASCWSADRAGRPGLRLADRQAAVVERRDRLERRVPGGQVGAGQEPALGRAEAIDLLGDEALVPGEARLLDLLLARTAAALVDDAPVRRRERRVAEERAGLGRREVELARAGPARERAPRCSSIVARMRSCSG